MTTLYLRVWFGTDHSFLAAKQFPKLLLTKEIRGLYFWLS